MHPSLQLLPNILQLGCHPFADRLSFHNETACRVRPTDMGETQKVKGLWLSVSSLLPPVCGKAPELDQARFVWVQFQPELLQPFPKLLQESFCVFPMLKSQHGIIGVAYDDHLPARHLLPPCLCPYIEYVVQVQIRKNRRNHRTLRSPFLRLEPLSVFHHARLQPFLDQAHDPFIPNSMLYKLDHPIVSDFVEKRANVQVD